MQAAVMEAMEEVMVEEVEACGGGEGKRGINGEGSGGQ